MKRGGCAIVLAFLFCSFVANAKGLYIPANNVTTTPKSVENFHNVSLGTTQSTPEANTTKLANDSTLLVVNVANEPTIEESPEKVITDIPVIKQQVHSSNSEEEGKISLSTFYGRIALGSGVSFLLIVIGAAAFLYAFYHYDNKMESNGTVIMGDVESADDEEDEIYRKLINEDM